MTVTSATPPIPPVPGGVRRRPFGLAVLSGLFLLRAAMLILAIVAPSLPDIDLLTRVLRMPIEIATAVRGDPVVGAIAVALIAGLLGATILLWRGRRTGWRIGILTTGLFLLIDLLEASRGDMHTLWMALDVVTVFYLNQQEVREYFAIGAEGSPG